MTATPTPTATATAILAVTLAVLCACGHATYPQAVQHPLMNQPLPDFKRRTVDGTTIEGGDLRGHAVVVKFFAEYCAPCKLTLPAAERVHQEYGDVAFIGVAEDESSETVRGVVNTYNLTFPVIHDAANVMSGKFRVSELPMTFVADRQGVIRWVGGEGQTEDDLTRAVEAAR